MWLLQLNKGLSGKYFLLYIEDAALDKHTPQVMTSLVSCVVDVITDVITNVITPDKCPRLEFPFREAQTAAV